MKKETRLIVRSPLRKQLSGLWILAASWGCYVMWQEGVKGQGSELMLTVAGLLALIGVYRCFSYSMTIFQPGNRPIAKQIRKHFIIFKTERSREFNELEILRRDSFLPYCQLYAYSSLDYLKKRLKPRELEKFEQGSVDLPGLVLVDHATKKECEKLIEKIWRYYGLWEGDLSDKNE